VKEDKIESLRLRLQSGLRQSGGTTERLSFGTRERVPFRSWLTCGHKIIAHLKCEVYGSSYLQERVVSVGGLLLEISQALGFDRVFREQKR
jgi:hypothetical protein